MQIKSKRHLLIATTLLGSTIVATSCSQKGSVLPNMQGKKLERPALDSEQNSANAPRTQDASSNSSKSQPQRRSSARSKKNAIKDVINSHISGRDSKSAVKKLVEQKQSQTPNDIEVLKDQLLVDNGNNGTLKFKTSVHASTSLQSLTDKRPTNRYTSLSLKIFDQKSNDPRAHRLFQTSKESAPVFFEDDGYIYVSAILDAISENGQKIKSTDLSKSKAVITGYAPVSILNKRSSFPWKLWLHVTDRSFNNVSDFGYFKGQIHGHSLK